MKNSKKQLDQINANESIKENSTKEFNSNLYSFNPTKKERSQLRRQRDSFIKSILRYNEEKNLEKRNEKIEEFKAFYKEKYLLNDYSLGSLSQSPMKSSNEIIEDFLNQLKRWKVELSLS